MAAYLEEVRKLEKRFLGMELAHIPRSKNQEADDIAKWATRREPQQLGVFEERLMKPSDSPSPEEGAPQEEELPPPPPKEHQTQACPWTACCSQHTR